MYIYVYVCTFMCIFVYICVYKPKCLFPNLLCGQILLFQENTDLGFRPWGPLVLGPGAPRC